MLMQNFKSADDLEITEKQKDALIKTLVLLETDKMTHVPESEHPPDVNNERKFSYQFNMNDWSYPHSCGTICCIGGTAEIIGNVKFKLCNLEYENKQLHRLFFPSTKYDYDKITPAKAAIVLRSYLTTGYAHWDLARCDITKFPLKK